MYTCVQIEFLTTKEESELDRSEIERKELQTKPDYREVAVQIKPDSQEVAVQIRPDCQEAAVQNSPDIQEVAVQTQREATNAEMAGRPSTCSHASILSKSPLLESVSIVKLCIAHSYISQATFVE